MRTRHPDRSIYFFAASKHTCRLRIQGLRVGTSPQWPRDFPHFGADSGHGVVNCSCRRTNHVHVVPITCPRNAFVSSCYRCCNHLRGARLLNQRRRPFNGSLVVAGNITCCRRCSPAPRTRLQFEDAPLNNSLNPNLKVQDAERAQWSRRKTNITESVPH